MMSDRRVVIISTGGTIACAPQSAAAGLGPSPNSAQDLAAIVQQRYAGQVDTHSYKNVLGTALVPEDLLAVAELARTALCRSEVAGVVVTAGTGIIEEGSYLCELVNDTGKPIVWTGAQRSANEDGWDGPRNLIDALRVAAAVDARDVGAGCLVCFNERVYAARDVVKIDKSNVDAFSAHDAGALARLDEYGIVWLRRAFRGPRFRATRLVTEVDLIKLACGSDDRFFRCAIASGSRAIVVEAFPGTGAVSPGAARGMRIALDASVLVVLATRSPQGRVLPRYGTELGAATLVKAGAVLGGSLSPEKLRMLLMVVLSYNLERAALLDLVASAVADGPH